MNIENDLDKKIDSLIIHNIPLSQSNSMTALRTVGKLVTPLLHSALTPTLSHISIQLILQNSDFIYVIEFGQYYSKDSNLKNGSFSSSSSDKPRKSTNKHVYYYINEDGARITRLSRKEIINELKKDRRFRFLLLFKEWDIKQELKDEIDDHLYDEVSKIIARGLIGELKDPNIFQEISNDFLKVECDVKNKITLRELCNNFKNEKWLAKKYNVVTHNCQTFAAEVIKILKAIRINEHDKIRTNEKFLLPNCIIKELWHNEDLSLNNTLGRIPIFGFFYDIGYNMVKNK